MAKQTKAQEKNAPQIVEAQIVNAETVHNVEIVKTSFAPVVAGQSVVLFNEENKERLIAAFVNAEVLQFGKSADDCKKLARKYAKLKVADKDDKEGYNAVKNAYNELVKIRTSTETERKEIGAPYAKIKSGIDAFAKQNVFEVLASTEAALKVQKDNFEKWEQEEKDRKEKEEQIRLDERIAELKTAGLEFDGDLYVINDISIDLGSVKKFSDFDYQALLEKVKIEKKKNDDAAEKAAAEKAAQDAKDQEEREKVERERKENRAEKLEMRTEKLEMLGFTTNEADERYEFSRSDYFYFLTFDEAAEMNKSGFDEYVEKHNKVLEKIKEAEVEAKTIQLLQARSQILFALDISDDEDGDGYWYNGQKLEAVDDEIISECDLKEWEDLLADIKVQMSAIDTANAAEKAAEKAAQDAKAAKEKAERDERLPDLEKVDIYANEVLRITLPALKNKEAVAVLEKLKSKIVFAVNEAMTELKKLS